LILSVVGLACGTALAAPASLTFPMPGQSMTFQVADASASRAAATRLDARPIQAGPGEVVSGWELTSRIVVQTDNPAALSTAVRDAQRLLTRGAAPSVTKFDAVDGFYIVDAGTLADASALGNALRASGQFASVEMDFTAPRVLRSVATDPNFTNGNQWHLRNNSVTIADINADGAWSQGYTGAGVVIGILEGGIQSNHPDLAGNYNATASQSGGFATSHGTSCAGIAAMVGNNAVGGAGLAYNADVSQQIYGSSTQTAAAFGFRNDLNDIKSNSWGPFDDGTVTYLSSVERTAIDNGIASGRGGLGTVFAWAAGNGGQGDRVEYDPYASYRKVTPIGAVGDLDVEASYNELGSSHLVCAHSSGNNRGTWTTNSGSGYTSGFGGTSSASPLGSGAIALAMEANPNLSWRDIQALLMETARKNDPSDTTWTTNAAGHDISYKFGYGTIDASALVAAAATWTNLGPEVSFDSGLINVATAIPDNNTTGVVRTVNVTDNIEILHAEVILNASHTFRGNLHITLTSPSGTESILAVNRSSDSGDNYADYIFTTRRLYQELSPGQWTIRVSDRTSGTTGTWNNFRLRIYGVAPDVCNSPADLNGDGQIDSGDLGIFVSAFTNNDLAADITGDGAVDSGDLGEFVALFRAGC
jgi:subtilisin-like proprotein convertase family protein